MLARSRPKSGRGKTPPNPPRSPTHESPWSSFAPNLLNPSVIPPYFSPYSPGDRRSHTVSAFWPSHRQQIETASNHTRAALIPEDPCHHPCRPAQTYRAPSVDGADSSRTTAATQARNFFRRENDEFEYSCTASNYNDQRSAQRDLRTCTEGHETAIKRNAARERTAAGKCRARNHGREESERATPATPFSH